MKQAVFATHARRLWEMGFSVIPVRGKSPVTKDWQRFCDERVSEDELETWESIYPSMGIGMPLGAASRLVCVDVDAEELVDRVPMSNARRRGAKGEARFFYVPEGQEIPRARNFRHAHIDFISTGKQVVVPPSVHPDTQAPYVWLIDEMTSNGPQAATPWKPEYLDILQALDNAAHKREIAEKAQEIAEPKRTGHATPDREGSENRNNILKDLAAAMWLRGESLDKVVEELWTRDTAFRKPLFTDESEGYDPKAPLAGARKFAESIQKSVKPSIPLQVVPQATDAQVIQFAERLELRESEVRAAELEKALPPMHEAHDAETGQDPDQEGEEEADGLLDPASMAGDPFMNWTPPPLPPKAGMLYRMMLEIDAMSDGPITALALSSGMALASVCIANRFACLGIQPNEYFLNIAKSGVGKSFGYRYITEKMASSGLLGAGAYKSSAALIDDLYAQRERLDLIDEFSGMLNTATRGSVGQTDMVEQLCALYTSSGAQYLAPMSISAKRANKPDRFWNPQISILTATTPRGLIDSATSNLSTKGLFPRFLKVPQMRGQFRGALERTRDPAIDSWLDFLLEIPVLRVDDPGAKGPRKKTGGMGGLLDTPDNPRSPREAVFTTKADAAMRAYRRECYDRIRGFDDVEDAEDARRFEHTIKLAMFEAASRMGTRELYPLAKDETFGTGDTMLVTESGWLWARAFVDWSFDQAGAIVAEMGQDHDQLKVMKVIKRMLALAKWKGCFKSELTSALKRYPRHVRESAFQTMLEAGEIQMFRSHLKSDWRMHEIQQRLEGRSSRDPKAKAAASQLVPCLYDESREWTRGVLVFATKHAPRNTSRDSDKLAPTAP